MKVEVGFGTAVELLHVRPAFHISVPGFYLWLCDSSFLPVGTLEGSKW